MKLEDKIISRVELAEALERVGKAYSYIHRSLVHRAGGDVAWWTVREEARLQRGIYQVTDALKKINDITPVFAHISTSDKTKVAFTPDKAFGERDAQLAMNFGKFVQRVLPIASDEFVKRLTEEHMADLSDEVEWITGTEIAEVYGTTSVQSCMAKNVKWELGHPALAYAASGIKLAVLRDSAGKINARCLVYENGDDKRMIRNYGDGRLTKRLTRLGYKAGGWQGVKFNTVKVTHQGGKDQVSVLMPYLDSMMGLASSEHCTVMLLDGVVQGVVHSQMKSLVAAGVQMTCASNTAGYVNLRPASSESFMAEDLVTGEKINILTDSAVKVFVDGKHGVTRQAPEGYVEATFGAGYSQEKAFVHKELTFEHYCKNYFDTPETRKGLGHCQLSEKYYPEKPWELRAVQTTDSQFIRGEDSINVYSTAGRSCIHKSELTKKLTRLADVDGEKWYAGEGVEILRTPSKAKVVMGLHAIKKAWNGIDYERNLQHNTDVFGEYVYCKRSEARSPEFLAHVKALAKSRLQESSDAYMQNNPNAPLLQVAKHLSNFKDLSNRFARRYTYPSAGNQYFTSSVYDFPRATSHVPFVPFFQEFLTDYLAADSECVKRQALVEVVRLKLAEMEAVEAPQRLEDAPVQAVAEEVEFA